MLFFIEIETRRVHVAGCTSRPAGDWVVQQMTRNLTWTLEDGDLRARFLIRDRDAKFGRNFDEVFVSEAVEVLQTAYRCPRMNAVAERWVGTARRECLDHVLVFGQRHLDQVLREFISHYHHARPHRSLALQPALAFATYIGVWPDQARGSTRWSAPRVSQSCLIELALLGLPHKPRAVASTLLTG